MLTTIALLLAAQASATPPPPTPPPPPRCTAARTAARMADCIEGSWSGPFLGADWTFELQRQDGAWTGRYITTRGKSWRPLLDLSITDASVSFGIQSQPKIGFRLALDREADTLTGAAEPEDRRPIPFTATRRP